MNNVPQHIKRISSDMSYFFCLGVFVFLGACTTRPIASVNSESDKMSADAGVKTLRILHIADTHAQLDTHWEYLPEDPQNLHRMGGFARLKTALDLLKSLSKGPVFSADGGDTFQGSAVAAWTKGEAIVGPLNALNLDVGTIGNWEVVYGPEVLEKLMSEVNYKVIAVNMQHKDSEKRLFAPYQIIEKQGVKIAFFGMTDPTTTERQPPVEVRGLDSTQFQDLKNMIADVKKYQKPDLIVLVSHQGLAPSIKLATQIPDINILLSGHTHERTYRPIKVGETIVIEPGSMGSFISCLDLTLQNGKILASDYKLVSVDANQFAEDPKVANDIKNIEAPYRKRLNRVVGSTNTALLRYDVLEGTMDNLVADSVREISHTDIGFTNGFRFSPPIAPGNITEADLWNILPLDTRIKVGKVSGLQLRKYIENELELVFAEDPNKLSGGWGPRPSGLKIVFRAKAQKGERVEALYVNNKKIEDEGTYSLSGCEREGEEFDIICRLKGVKNTKYISASIHQALERYVSNHSPLTFKKERRAVATDLPSTIWSQYSMLQKMWNLPGQSEAMEYSKK